jgi:hypothetical protein
MIERLLYLLLEKPNDEKVRRQLQIELMREAFEQKVSHSNLELSVEDLSAELTNLADRVKITCMNPLTKPEFVYIKTKHSCEKSSPLLKIPTSYFIKHVFHYSSPNGSDKNCTFFFIKKLSIYDELPEMMDISHYMKYTQHRPYADDERNIILVHGGSRGENIAPRFTQQVERVLRGTLKERLTSNL